MAGLTFNHKVEVSNRQELLRLRNLVSPNEHKKQSEVRENKRIREEFKNIPFKLN